MRNKALLPLLNIQNPFKSRKQPQNISNTVFALQQQCVNREGVLSLTRVTKTNNPDTSGNHLLN
jgi:hypothetical protein